jgi:hypothetical protein
MSQVSKISQNVVLPEECSSDLVVGVKATNGGHETVHSEKHTLFSSHDAFSQKKLDRISKRFGSCELTVEAIYLNAADYVSSGHYAKAKNLLKVALNDAVSRTQRQASDISSMVELIDNLISAENALLALEQKQLRTSSRFETDFKISGSDIKSMSSDAETRLQASELESRIAKLHEQVATDLITPVMMACDVPEQITDTATENLKYLRREIGEELLSLNAKLQNFVQVQLNP